MSRVADVRSAGGQSWVDRVNAQVNTASPTAKTDETPAMQHVNMPQPSAKTDETPHTEPITSVLAVTPTVHTATQQLTFADQTSA